MKSNPHRIWLVNFLLVVCDAVLFYGVFRLGWIVRNWMSPVVGYTVPWQSVTPLAQLSILGGIAIFVIQGLYPGYGLTAVKELEKLTKNISLLFFILAGVAYFNRAFLVFSRLIVFFSWGLALGLLPVARFAVRHVLANKEWYGAPVVIFGDDPEWTAEIADTLRRIARMGWKIRAFQPLNQIENLAASKAEFDIAILAPSSKVPVRNYARTLRNHFRKVIVVQERNNFGSFYVESRDLDGHLGLEFHYHLLTSQSLWIKNLIDLTLGFLIFLLLSPVFAVLSLLIYINSPGPVFFRQRRYGKNFRQFDVFKFRTMIPNAEQKLEEILMQDAATKDAYAKYHKIIDDPRITPIGHWLRRYSLDELPQLFNVLRGEMSLVGPRAYMVTEIDDMENYAPIILRVKPGMSGWWQVMGRHQTTFKDRLRMDEHYISNWSIWMDIYILFRTGWVVLSGTGT